MPSPCHPPGPSPVLQWTPSHVRSWLTGLGLAKYSKQLCDQHRIDGPALLMLQEEDLRQPPLSLDILGDIKHLTYHINTLRFDLQCSDQKVQYCLYKQSSSSPPQPILGTPPHCSGPTLLPAQALMTPAMAWHLPWGGTRTSRVILPGVWSVLLAKLKFIFQSQTWPQSSTQRDGRLQ